VGVVGAAAYHNARRSRFQKLITALERRFQTSLVRFYRDENFSPNTSLISVWSVSLSTLPVLIQKSFCAAFFKKRLFSLGSVIVCVDTRATVKSGQTNLAIRRSGCALAGRRVAGRVCWALRAAGLATNEDAETDERGAKEGERAGLWH
jgi:hypothetical protein